MVENITHIRNIYKLFERLPSFGGNLFDVTKIIARGTEPQLCIICIAAPIILLLLVMIIANIISRLAFQVFHEPRNETKSMTLERR